MNPFRTDARIVTLAVARMADSLGNSFLIIVLPLYIASERVTGDGLGLSTAAVTGFILAVFGLVSAVVQPLVGRFSDRLGKRKLFILSGLVVLAAANFSFSLFTSYAGLLVTRAVQGLAAAFTITASVALVNELSSAEQRGGNLGVYNAFRLVGFGAGPLLAGTVLAYGPYTVPGLGRVSSFDATFYLASAAALVSGLLVLLLVHDAPDAEPDRRKLELAVFSNTPGRALDPVFTLGLATLFLSSCIALLSPIEPQVNARLGQGPVLFAVEFGVLVGALALVQPIVGTLSDRRGRKRFIVWGLVALVPTTLLQGFVLEPWQLISLRTLQGVAGAAVFAPALALAGDLAKKGQSGATLSVLTVAFGLGISLGQIASGTLAGVAFFVPFALGAALAALGVLLVQTQVDDVVQDDVVQDDVVQGGVGQGSVGQDGVGRDKAV